MKEEDILQQITEVLYSSGDRISKAQRVAKAIRLVGNYRWVGSYQAALQSSAYSTATASPDYSQTGSTNWRIGP